MDMVISTHSPFVKVWFIIQLIAEHLNWWMWIGSCFTWKSATDSAKKLDHFLVPFVELWGVYFQDAGKAVKEFWCFILLCIVWEEDHPQAIRNILGTKISLYSHLTSAKNRVMLDHSAVCKVFECANTTGRWDKHVNRKCKAGAMCMSQWVFDLWINHYL